MSFRQIACIPVFVATLSELVLAETMLISVLRKLHQKYRDRPMSLADACIVRMAEIYERHRRILMQPVKRPRGVVLRAGGRRAMPDSTPAPAAIRKNLRRASVMAILPRISRDPPSMST
jgi:hypothetical protein